MGIILIHTTTSSFTTLLDICTLRLGQYISAHYLCWIFNKQQYSLGYMAAFPLATYNKKGYNKEKETTGLLISYLANIYWGINMNQKLVRSWTQDKNHSVPEGPPSNSHPTPFLSPSHTKVLLLLPPMPYHLLEPAPYIIQSFLILWSLRTGHLARSVASCCSPSPSLLLWSSLACQPCWA